MLELITGAVDDRSARGIAAAVSRLVSAGTLPSGARLPTVRDVARELGISPTTVITASDVDTRPDRGAISIFISCSSPGLRPQWFDRCNEQRREMLTCSYPQLTAQCALRTVLRQNAMCIGGFPR